MFVSQEICDNHFPSINASCGLCRVGNFVIIFSACLLLHYVASLVWPLFVHWCFFTFVQTCLTKHSQCDLTLSLNSFKCSLVHLLLFDKWACFQQQPFVCYKLYNIFAYNQCRYLQAAHNDLEVIMVRPALITRNHKL